MTIQKYPDELNYVNAKLIPFLGLVGTDALGSGRESKSFLNTFLQACLRADGENYEILRPALHFFMGRYPADEKRLAAEIRDSGTP